MRHRPTMKRLGRRLGALTIGLTVFGTVVAPIATHAAEPNRQAPLSEPQPKKQPVTVAGDLKQLVAASGGSVPVTLITGDTMRVGVDAEGKPVARDIRIAARPDGTDVAVQTITLKGRVHVVPDDAVALLGNGVLDWGLFDLAELAKLATAGTAGGEGEADEVPVLVTYTAKAAAHKAPKVAGTTVGKELPSINGRSMDIAHGGRWWQGVRGKTDSSSSAARSAGSLAGVKKVWLDGLAKIDLETSVPQIGAKAAWDRGYDGAGVYVAVLDTGIDPEHADVSGNLVEQVDFTGGASGARDGHGHGTHVAATVAGTGAASKGLRKGVAPGAKLRVGKVLDDRGSGATSWIIAGMEWAARSGAKVVNMSLGGGPTDGTDPLSQSLNELTRTTGTLFVVAGGNSGPDSESVGSPGAADEALTVAAVDKADKTADFSSRGPRVGDGGAKPDIAAPGVAIVAARAAGTAMGTVVDEHYTSASGTSMATPHVAGAAALMAQQHPNLTGPEIKAMLMSTATDLGQDMFAQGVGRVSLATALDPTVTVNGDLSFGRLVHAHAPVTKKVTYTNHTDEPVTLKLSASISRDGEPAPAGLVTLGMDEVVVPANGSADVPVTLSGKLLGAAGPFGGYHGRLIARDSSGALRASSSVTAFLEPVMFPLTVNVIRPPGASQFAYLPITFVPLDDNAAHDGPVTVAGAHMITMRFIPGTYAVSYGLRWLDEAGLWNQAMPLLPEVSLTKATTVTLDLRKLTQPDPQTPEATDAFDGQYLFDRVSATGEWGLKRSLPMVGTAAKRWVMPNDKVRTGTLTHEVHSVRTTPVVSMNAVGGSAPYRLSPHYVAPDVSTAVHEYVWKENGKEVKGSVKVPIPRLPVKGHVPVVYAGTGTAAELAGVAARGKLVLMTPTDICAVDTPRCDFPKLRDERVAAAHAAGALGVMVAAMGLNELYSTSGTSTCTGGLESCPAAKPYAALPIVRIPYGEADHLIKRIKAAPSKAEIILGGSAKPTVYAARYATGGAFPANLLNRPNKKDYDRVDHHFHADRPGEVTDITWQQHAASGPAAIAVNLPRSATQQTLTTYIKRQDNAVNRFSTVWADHARPSVLVRGGGERQDVSLGARSELHWNQGPTVPGAVTQVRTKSGFALATGTLCVGCRQGNTFHPNFFLSSSGGAPQTVMGSVFADLWIPGLTEYGGQPCMPPACDFKLFNEAGEEIAGFTDTFPIGGAGRVDAPGRSPGSRR